MEASSAARDWRAARYFVEKGPSAQLQFLKEEPRCWLFALHAQATLGPYDDNLASTSASSGMVTI
eukprot:jgi/Chlat1/5191/Chrsp33S05169